MNIWFFDSAGTYVIEVISSIPLAFYQYFPNGRFIVQFNKSTFYFDAMPRYETAGRSLR